MRGNGSAATASRPASRRSCATARAARRSPRCASVVIRRPSAPRRRRGRRDIVRGEPVFKLVQEPEPVLGEGEGKRSRRTARQVFASGVTPAGHFRRDAGERPALASPSMVRLSKSRARAGISIPSRSVGRAVALAARSEWPPRWKKSSWIPTRAAPSTSCQTDASSSSTSSRGAT